MTNYRQARKLICFVIVIHAYSQLSTLAHSVDGYGIDSLYDRVNWTRENFIAEYLHERPSLSLSHFEKTV